MTQTPSTAARVLPLLLLLVPLLCGAPFAVADTADRDIEPEPPWVFFPTPDAATAREIDEIVGGFGDPNKAVFSRDILIRRFGLWSAPMLVAVLAAEEEARNQSKTWNAALTAYAMRDLFGNARELWPLVPPLVDLLEDSAEPYRRAYAALALGSFHNPAFAPMPPAHPDGLVVLPPEVEYRRELERAVRALGSRVTDMNQQVRVAVALALGKSGAPSARSLLRASDRLARNDDTAEKTVAGRQAVLLAVGLLPGQADEDLLIDALADVDRKIRRAAALAVALQALHDHPPPWVREVRPLHRALRSSRIKQDLEDGAEAVFARGVLAAKGVIGPREWREIYDLAANPFTKDDVVRAATQVLLFCPEPWFPKKMLERIQEGADMKPVTVAAFLLLLGESGTEEGLAICRDYLGNPGRKPKSRQDWDVRTYAAVGLLRALASGDVEDPELRREILDALDAGVKRGLMATPFRDALKRLLERERERVLQNPHYSIPEVRVLQVERSFRDPHGLLARDLRDVAVVRLNDMIPDVFSIQTYKPGTPGARTREGVARRVLETTHQRFPYFTRLDLKADRGIRPPDVMARDRDPKREVRR